MHEEENEYASNYSQDKFWAKLGRHARSAGKEVVEYGLLLYYVLQRADLPAWAKARIYAALGYLILPVDAIPDAVPMVGFADDLGVLVVAIGSVAMYVDDEVRRRAKEKLRQWFADEPPDGDDEERRDRAADQGR